MHELSIAQSLIEAASEAAADAGAKRVTRVMVRIGRLSGVVAESLLFSFDLAAEGTACDGARLEIEDVPITVRCDVCDAEHELTDTYRLCCPQCGQPTPEIVSGRELDLHSIEVATERSEMG